MSHEVKLSKSELRRKDVQELRTGVEKESWIALSQYFNGAGNGAEAKVAVVVLGTLARERQVANNSRQLDIMEKRLLLDKDGSAV